MNKKECFIGRLKKNETSPSFQRRERRKLGKMKKGVGEIRKRNHKEIWEIRAQVTEICSLLIWYLVILAYNLID